jgi:hypothetical protein
MTTPLPGHRGGRLRGLRCVAFRDAVRRRSAQAKQGSPAGCETTLSDYLLRHNVPAAAWRQTRAIPSSRRFRVAPAVSVPRSHPGVRSIAASATNSNPEPLIANTSAIALWCSPQMTRSSGFADDNNFYVAPANSTSSSYSLLGSRAASCFSSLTGLPRARSGDVRRELARPRPRRRSAEASPSSSSR